MLERRGLRVVVTTSICLRRRAAFCWMILYIELLPAAKSFFLGQPSTVEASCRLASA